LVLTPEHIDGVASKPGAIGFTEVTVESGSQANNGLSLISMSLVDVQGNKFTDVNSPWAFIYDARPGNIGGDFWFRYGWQVILPDINDPESARFWNHEGWLLFGDSKKQIQAQLIPGKSLITLTQAINVNKVGIKKDKITGQGINNEDALVLFDEGVVFDDTTGVITVNKDMLGPDNYVKLSLLNPELSQGEDGALIAKLNFMTTGAIAQNVLLDYAVITRRILRQGNVFKLGDILLAVMDDSSRFGFLAINTKEQRLKQVDATDQRIAEIAKSRDFSNLVYIVGPEGANGSSINPDDVIIKIEGDLFRKMAAPNKEDGETLLGWFRKVLQENECELLSAGTGSGAGINATWIIVTTQKISQNHTALRAKPQTSMQTLSQNFKSIITSEKDVFSYRFQGSLVSTMAVEHTDTPNSMKIAADFAVAGLADMDSTDPNSPISSKPISATDRTRNLTVVFAQMQNININCLAHPWLGVGKTVFIKGMGFYDGEYLLIEITHKLEGQSFTSHLVGARILAGTNESLTSFLGEVSQNDKDTSAANGKGQMAQPVSEYWKGVALF
jgi:hypothetical protein